MGFEKGELAIDCCLGYEAILVVPVVEVEGVKGGLHVSQPSEVHIDGFVDLVVVNAPDNKIISREGWFTLSTLANKVNPPGIVFEKSENIEFGKIVIELEDIQKRGFMFELSFSKSPALGLLLERSEVEPRTEVEVLARALNVGALYDRG